MTVFGLGLIVGGLGLLATAAVGLGQRYRLFDGRRRNRLRRDRANVRRSARPSDPSALAVSVMAAPLFVPGRDMPARGAPPGAVPRGNRAGNRARPPSSRALVNARVDVQGPRPRDINKARRPDPSVGASALIADTVLLQPVPAWSAPAPGGLISDPTVTVDMQLPPRDPG
jgi:hypothetical protein